MGLEIKPQIAKGVEKNYVMQSHSRYAKSIMQNNITDIYSISTFVMLLLRLVLASDNLTDTGSETL